MPRRLGPFLLSLLLLVIAVRIPALAKPLDVLYVVMISRSGPSELHTFNVDPSSGTPTEVGAITAPNIYGVVSSPDGHFLYVLGGDTGGKEHVWVYPTQANGSPQAVPLQVINLPNAYGRAFAVHPSGKLAYAVETTYNSQWQVIARLRIFNVDPQTGVLTKSQLLRPSPPNGPCGTGWSVSGFLQLSGFLHQGAQLIEQWACSNHDGGFSAYYRREVNRQTGELGPEIQFFGVYEGEAWFTRPSVIAWSSYDYAVYVYPPNGGYKPIITCTLTMLAGCGNALGALAHPSGQYIVLDNSLTMATLGRIDLIERRIVDTGDSIPDLPLQFSPDGSLLYTLVPNNWQPPWQFQIYVFDQNTGAVQQGGTLQVPSAYYMIIPAVRF